MQWNAIIYANVTLPLTLVSNKLNVPFFSTLLNEIEIVTAFKYIFEETMPKLSVIFGNHISQDSYKNQYPGPVCYFGFTAPQYSDKCWSNLPPKRHIFLIGHTEITVPSARSSASCSGYHMLVKKHNKMTSLLYQRIRHSNQFNTRPPIQTLRFTEWLKRLVGILNLCLIIMHTTLLQRFLL